MSGAVISSNASLKVNAAVSNSITADGTLYTAPANSYAIVQISYQYTSGTIPRLLLAGNTILQLPTNTSMQVILLNLIVGPSQALTVVDGLSTGFRATVSGVNLINSP